MVLEQVRLLIIIVCLIITFPLIVIIHIHAFVVTKILVFIRRDDLNMMVEGAWNLGVTGEYLSPSSYAADVDGTDETNKSICLRRAFGLSFNNPRFGRVSYNP